MDFCHPISIYGTIWLELNENNTFCHFYSHPYYVLTQYYASIANPPTRHDNVDFNFYFINNFTASSVFILLQFEPVLLLYIYVLFMSIQHFKSVCFFIKTTQFWKLNYNVCNAEIKTNVHYYNKKLLFFFFNQLRLIAFLQNIESHRNIETKKF